MDVLFDSEYNKGSVDWVHDMMTEQGVMELPRVMKLWKTSEESLDS